MRHKDNAFLLSVQKKKGKIVSWASFCAYEAILQGRERIEGGIYGSPRYWKMRATCLGEKMRLCFL